MARNVKRPPVDSMNTVSLKTTGTLTKAPKADPVAALGTVDLRAPEEPVSPAPQAPVAEQAIPVQSPVQPTQTAIEAAPGPVPKKAGPRAKLTLTSTEATNARLRAAFHNTRTLPGAARSFSEWATTVLLAEVARLEAQHNGGEQWPPLSGGSMPTGRPLGS